MRTAPPPRSIREIQEGGFNLAITEETHHSRPEGGSQKSYSGTVPLKADSGTHAAPPCLWAQPGKLAYPLSASHISIDLCFSCFVVMPELDGTHNLEQARQLVLPLSYSPNPVSIFLMWP